MSHLLQNSQALLCPAFSGSTEQCIAWVQDPKNLNHLAYLTIGQERYCDDPVFAEEDHNEGLLTIDVQAAFVFEGIEDLTGVPDVIAQWLRNMEQYCHYETFVLYAMQCCNDLEEVPLADLATCSTYGREAAYV